jgi:hypothetical protein
LSKEKPNINNIDVVIPSSEEEITVYKREILSGFKDVMWRIEEVITNCHTESEASLFDRLHQAQIFLAQIAKDIFIIELEKFFRK